jgi:methylmalonyl-CoA mutase
METTAYQSKNKIRIVTAAALFDGHDAAINIMRRIMQSSGAEVIHLGHDRSVIDVVNCAIQEDANAIAITSYQGGHVEYFKYMHDLLKERGCGHIKIFGGGGGVILPTEIAELHAYGITRIYSPDDGREIGLQGMINDVLRQSDYPTGVNLNGEVSHIAGKDHKSIAKLISAAENGNTESEAMMKKVREMAAASKTPVLGITGTGGAGKSSLVDELVRRFLIDFPEKQLGIISVDPSKRKTGGALLGDRIRMNSIRNDRVFMRSMATRQSNLALSKHVQDAVDILKASNFDMIILETAGIGQSDTEITEHSNMSLYVMTPEYGAATQLEKIDMIEFADIIALNKFDKRGALDAIRDVKKQYKRNHNLWETPDEQLPVYGTIASQFNDPGMNSLYKAVMDKLVEKTGANLKSGFAITDEMSEKIFIIPPARTRYLSEISENNRSYDRKAEQQAEVAEKLYSIKNTIAAIKESKMADKDRLVKSLEEEYAQVELDFDGHNKKVIDTWAARKENYTNEYFIFKVRDKEIKIKTHYESLSHSQIPKISVPRFNAWGDILRWNLQENFPGDFPYTAGIYPFKREGEDPTRMFAGEGGPERTNKRFHYVSKGLPAKRV